MTAALTSAAVTMDTGTVYDTTINNDEELIMASGCSPTRCLLLNDEGKIKARKGTSSIHSDDENASKEHAIMNTMR